MCICCGGYVIIDDGLMICRCDGVCLKCNAYLTSHVCEKCSTDMEDSEYCERGSCYRVRSDKTSTELDTHCKAIIREMAIVWVGTCYDFMFMPKPYVNRSYFRSEFTRRLRKHFGFTSRVPFE